MIRTGTQREWWGSEASSDLGEKHEEWGLVVDSFIGEEIEDGWNRAECAICLASGSSKDDKRSLGFNTRTRGYNCYKCGCTGMLPRRYVDRLGEEVLELTDKEDDPEARAAATVVEQPIGWRLLFAEDPTDDEPCTAPFREFLTGSRETKPLGGRARQLSRQACFEAGCGVVLRPVYQPPEFNQLKLRNRIIVPIWNYGDLDDEDLRGWVARDVTGRNEVPYLNPKGMPREYMLFNEPALYVETEDPLLVVEGTMDALRFWPHAVAVLGKPMQTHAAMLKSAKRPVVVILDGDAWEAGLAFAWTVKIRAPHLRVGAIRLPPKVDPDDFGLVTPWAEVRELALESML